MRRPLLSMLLGLLFLTAPALASTPAGTEIVNQAAATFQPPTPGEAGQALSNVVRTTVQAVCAVSVTPDGTVATPGQHAEARPGETASFRYQVMNAGNAEFFLPLSARVEPGSAHTPSLQLLHDRNGNGAADAGEAAVTGLRLAAGESAALLLLARTDRQDRGDAFVNVIAGCADGRTDQTNVSRLRLGAPPVLTVTKTFSPDHLRPGDETTVTVTVRNVGEGVSGEVVLDDPLAAQAAQGLHYVPGSARSGAGTLEYLGAAWTEQEPAEVRGVRVRLPDLGPGAAATLTFRMRASAAAEGRRILNVATAQAGTETARGEASADVGYRPGVALGPLGQPLVPEDSPADRQTRAAAVLGQPVCFDHTLRNTGDVRDRYAVTVSYPQGAAQTTLLGAGGEALVQPVALEPGQETVVRACHVATQSGPLEVLLVAVGERGPRNVTRDVVLGVEAGLPELHKSVEPAPTRPVVRGEVLTYTLRVHNRFAQPLTGAVIEDALPAHVVFHSASAGGVKRGEPGAEVVTWTPGTLAPGETREFTVVVRVSEQAVDGETLRNDFRLLSPALAGPVLSNEVGSPVWNAALLITKATDRPQVAPGDRLTYTLQLRNLSATTPVHGAEVTDTPDPGLSYLPGSSTLGGEPVPDPTVVGAALRWAVGTLPPGEAVTLTYQMRVTAQATGDLVNRAEVTGRGADAQGPRLGSNVATALTRLGRLVAAPLGDVLGTVFIDRDRDGRFDPQQDTPVERARVLLAGGRQVLTDAAGRYHFAGVPLGTHALRLDPGSVPWVPLAHPADGGRPGTRTVNVAGLTSVDFALAPLEGGAGALRQVHLTAGPLQAHKTVQRVAAGRYEVTLRLVTTALLPDFVLDDPLPPGASLQEGRQTLSGLLEPGEHTLTYRFAFAGPQEQAVTDPTVRWRDARP